MRFIAVILSFYVIMLTFKPCADVIATDSDCYSIVQQDQEHNSSDINLCSPFCYCTCCQSVSQAEYDEVIKVNLSAFNLIVPSIENDISSPVIHFWRPPKI